MSMAARNRIFAALAIVVVGAKVAGLAGVAHADEDEWPSIARELYQDRKIADAADKFALYVPAQAADAAIVPVSVRFPENTAVRVKSMTLVIDRNPAPVVATFEFGNAFRDSVDVGERLIETRVRVDSFSNLRAVVEMQDGSLHMASKFVAGAGGCSAPTGKDPEAALAGLGKVKIDVRRDQVRGKTWRDARIMIKHPNFTGMQMDPMSGNYTPARFVETLEIKRGGELMMKVSGGISLSENPHIRVTYGTDRDETIEVSGVDTLGSRFSGSTGAGGS